MSSTMALRPVMPLRRFSVQSAFAVLAKTRPGMLKNDLRIISCPLSNRRNDRNHFNFRMWRIQELPAPC